MNRPTASLRYSEHREGDGRHPHHSEASGSRPLILAVGLTTGYAVVELIGGLWSGSLALLADCGHLATDAAALLFSLAANKVAQRPVSARHSFGLARAEVIAAFVNSLALLAVVAWLLIEGIDRIRHPVGVNGAAVALIAGVGLGVNLVVAWVLSRHRDNLNMRAALLHVLGDLLGSVATLAAGVVIYFTGYWVVDPLLSMLVSGLILRSTLGVLKESTLVLLNSVPSGVEFQAVGQALARIEGVRSIHDLHVWSMVPGRHAVSAHLLVDRIERWPLILREARSVLARDFGIDHVTLQLEWLRTRPAEQTIALRELP
ncbi:MAG TPA: cation diffusion facilitator family transporter [Burkholderiaceae bacterium]|nr:cation diffusion facilitator family transporter [Burkholderiaceae bacterium]